MLRGIKYMNFRLMVWGSEDGYQNSMRSLSVEGTMSISSGIYDSSL